MKKKSYTTPLILLIAIIAIISVISENYFFRIDMTAGKQYSLSEATEDILKNLDEPITITAYFTEELAPDLDKVKRNFKDLLIEYNSLSHGNVVYKFVNPNEDQKIENEAIQAGIRPVLFNAREKDQVKQQKVFMGAKIMKGTDSEVLPFIDPNGSIEYALSTAIKKLTVSNRPLIGFVQGQGEQPVEAFQQVLADLSVLYDVRPVTLSDTTRNLFKFKTLVVVAPVDSFAVHQLDLLDQYLSQGGNVFIAMNKVEGNFQTLQGEAINTGLEGWLQQRGIEVEEAFVVDASCGTVGVQQQNGAFNMTTQVKFPYLPFVNRFNEHIITKGLEQIVLQFASPIRYTGDTSRRFIPLAMSSEKSGVQQLPVFFDVNKRWNDGDFVQANNTLAAILEGKGTEGNIVVVSDGDFAVNGTGRRPRQLQPDNVSLMVNSIDWLSDDTGLIGLRTKEVTSRPLDQISEAKTLFLKWLNFLLPLILVIVYGLIRLQQRRNQRIKRMQEGYVK